MNITKELNQQDELSAERKKLQSEGLVPDWYTTAGWQMFKEKYQVTGENAVKGRFETIAETLAKHAPDPEHSEYHFFELLWKGWLSPSTPVLANTGTNRGLPVSCSGNYVGDSIDSFYSSLHETAVLTKHGFGTSGYLSDIRPRGSKIRSGGKANGVLPVFKEHLTAMQNVSQGGIRRGAYAGYFDIESADFDELSNVLLNETDGTNVGWIIKDSFVKALQNKDKKAKDRFAKVLKIKLVTGKGYFFFVDKVNRKRPESYVKNNLDVKASNLCSEITLHSSEEYTFTCVLSSLNLAKYNEWKDTDTIHWSILFLDCVAQEFIEKAKNIKGLEKAVKYTENARSLGLGVCGFHTYLMQENIAYESLEANFRNIDIFKQIREKSEMATQYLAERLGEPKFCKGLNRRNTHLLAIAPTKSTALIMGGVSEGINPEPAMTYTQTTAAGEINRINPVLLSLMKSKGIYDAKHIKEIVDNLGSVQDVNWLTPEEKLVFRTAYEINQEVVLRLAGIRGKYLDQWQSLNLFFAADADPKEIAKIHQQAFLDEKILGLYYIYSKAGVKGSVGECIACQ